MVTKHLSSVLMREKADVLHYMTKTTKQELTHAQHFQGWIDLNLASAVCLYPGGHLWHLIFDSWLIHRDLIIAGTSNAQYPSQEVNVCLLFVLRILFSDTIKEKKLLHAALSRGTWTHHSGRLNSGRAADVIEGVVTTLWHHWLQWV